MDITCCHYFSLPLGFFSRSAAARCALWHRWN